MKNENNIVIFGEIVGEALSDGTKQLLRIGKELCQKRDQQLNLVFFGGQLRAEAAQGYAYGADNVYQVVNPALENYLAEPALRVIEQVIERLCPQTVLFMHDDKGLELAPRLAFRLKTGVTLDCIDFVIAEESDSPRFVKPVLGGKAYGVYSHLDDALKIATVRKGAFDPADFDESRIMEPIDLNIIIDVEQNRTTLIKKEKDLSLKLALKLDSAEVVVCGGRGLKNRDGVEVIQKLADLLDGAIAGSRPAVDAGWIPYSLQIGLTGRKVNPQVYFGIGISGAIQHMAGCLKAKHIIAINSDKNAPIFRMSHIGVVGNYTEVLNSLISELESQK